jgi:hypothetical protein
MLESTDSTQIPSCHNHFRMGLWLCWLSLLALPLGLLAIGGGPCAGPRNALGSAILLSVGMFGFGGGLFGIVRIFQGIKQATNLLRVAGALSVAVATLASLVGGAYLLFGYVSLRSFLRY